jgi:hypothetical protein
MRTDYNITNTLNEVRCVVIRNNEVLNERQIDLIDGLRWMDLNDPDDDLIDDISDRDIRWLIDHYDLSKHNSKIFGMRYNWEHPNFSRKQRWMVIAESSKLEKNLFGENK